MSIVAGETRIQKEADKFFGEFNANYATTQAENVHVVVFDALVGGVSVVD